MASDARRLFLLPRDSWWPPSETGCERRVLSLPDPRHGRARKYMLEIESTATAPRLLEVQQVAHPSPSSWFVDQAVLSDGCALVATPVDALFWLLPHMGRLSARDLAFSVEELLKELAPATSSSMAARALQRILQSSLREQCEAACSAVCDLLASDASGTETSSAAQPPKYNLSISKATTVLLARAARVARSARERASKAVAALRAAQSSFSAVSRTVAPAAAAESASSSAGAGTGSSSPDSSAAGAGAAAGRAASVPLASIEAVHWETALEVLSEYVASEWLDRLKAAIPALRSASAAGTGAGPKPAGAAAAGAVGSRAASGAASMHHDGDADYGEEPEDGSGVASGAGAGAMPSSSSSAAAAAASSGASKAAMWNAQALEDDALTKFTRIGSSSGGGGGGGSGSAATSPSSVGGGGTAADAAAGTGVKRKAPTPTLTVAQRKLAAVNTKGMKSMTAFFGAAAKKPE